MHKLLTRGSCFFVKEACESLCSRVTCATAVSSSNSRSSRVRASVWFYHLPLDSSSKSSNRLSCPDQRSGCQEEALEEASASEKEKTSLPKVQREGESSEWIIGLLSAVDWNSWTSRTCRLECSLPSFHFHPSHILYFSTATI